MAGVVSSRLLLGRGIVLVSVARRVWQEGKEYAFAIVQAQDGQFLGGCGLNQINRVNRFANLGYWVRTSQAGHGVATVAARLLAQFGFGELKLSRLELVIDVDNQASQRVAEKLGAFREGVLRQRLSVHNQARDAVMYSLIPRDLKS